MNLIPSHLEQELLQYIKQKYLPSRFKKTKRTGFTDKDLMFFAQGAALLSDAFTVERTALPKNYFNKKEYRSAYLLYFTLTNFAKSYKCLNETWDLSSLSNSKQSKMDILDLGCGPGTASLACSHFFRLKKPKLELQITGIDQNQGILEDAKELFQKLGNSKHKFQTKQQVISANINLGKKYDLIIAANVLNEFRDQNYQYKLCSNLLNHLKHDGCLIILDPALQKTTRPLMELRNNILRNLKGFKVLSPCLHQADCPMLTHNRRDWCHFYLEWKCPQIIRKIDQLLGIKHDYLKMAYLIFQKASGVQHKGYGKEAWRVVSSPLFSKGKTELILCANKRLRKIMRLDKYLSPANAILPGSNKKKTRQQAQTIKRGDIITIDVGHDRIGKNTNIKIQDNFNY